MTRWSGSDRIREEGSSPGFPAGYMCNLQTVVPLWSALLPHLSSERSPTLSPLAAHPWKCGSACPNLHESGRQHKLFPLLGPSWPIPCTQKSPISDALLPTCVRSHLTLALGWYTLSWFIVQRLTFLFCIVLGGFIFRPTDP